MDEGKGSSNALKSRRHILHCEHSAGDHGYGDDEDPGNTRLRLAFDQAAHYHAYPDSAKPDKKENKKGMPQIADNGQAQRHPHAKINQRGDDKHGDKGQ